MINVKADEIHRLLFTSFTQNPTISLPSVNILYLSILSIFFLACSAGVLLERVSVTSPRSFVPPEIFDLE